MPTAIVASTIAQADSADITLTTDSATISLFTAAGVSIPGDAKADIQVKASNGVYRTNTTLGVGMVQTVVQAPCTFRVRKYVTPVAVGVDRD